MDRVKNTTQLSKLTFAQSEPVPADEDLEPAPALQIKSRLSEVAPAKKGRGKSGLWISLGVAAALVWGLGGWWLMSDKDKNQASSPKANPTGAGKTASSAEVAINAAAPTPAGVTSAFQATARRWTNSLGQVFVPVPGTEVNFSIWLTRVQDFEAFVKATGYDAAQGMFSLRADGVKQRGDAWRGPGFAQGPTHPVCGVSWKDAQAFCKWLTEKERTEGKLTAAQSYRLPQDWEWSAGVGLNEVKAGTPKDKDEKIQDVYPWGTQWPPPAGAGNYAGEEAKNADWPAHFKMIEGYRDGYERTSPVGSFAANRFGLYDMGGNLSQWCVDWYDEQQTTRVLRGASWGNGDPRRLFSSVRRFHFMPTFRNDGLGFRVVLVGGSAR